MIELAKHIEVLLLENDCVIVPGLGGFIAHNRQAEFKESNGLFCSPVRTIGFNPQLVMNDGLLVQTYMQAYSTDFPDATRKIEETVSALKEQLYQTGEATLPNIGTLYYTMNGTYVFEPSSETFFTPYLYGLGNFAMTPLKALKATEEESAKIHPFIVQKEQEAETAFTENTVHYGRTFRKLAQHAVGVAAAILLFFLLSVPVENTYMDDASYASLSAESMFDAIRGRSVATHLLSSSDETAQVNPHHQVVNRTKNNVNTLKPVAVKTVVVAQPAAEPAVKKEVAASKVAMATSTKAVKAVTSETSKAEPAAVKAVKETKTAKQAPTKGYYIIVASLPTASDAQKMVQKFRQQGYDKACALDNNQRHRIALYRFNDSGDAYKKLNELRKQEDFKSSWVFTAK